WWVSALWLGCATRPRSALSPSVIRALDTVWTRVKESVEIRTMVVASTVPLMFSAGADIKAFSSMDEAECRDMIATVHTMFREFGTNKITTIAAVNGIAFGGGCELAMACDARPAAQSPLCAQPEIKLGIIPGFGGTQRLPRLVGDAKALEMNLVGDAIRAEEAYEFGLVNQVLPDHELFDAALALARRLSQSAALAAEPIN